MNKGKKQKEHETFHYFHVPLSLMIRFYIEEALNNEDWEILAVDSSRDKIVLRRFGKEK